MIISKFWVFHATNLEVKNREMKHPLMNLCGPITMLISQCLAKSMSSAMTQLLFGNLLFKYHKSNQNGTFTSTCSVMTERSSALIRPDSLLMMHSMTYKRLSRMLRRHLKNHQKLSKKTWKKSFKKENHTSHLQCLKITRNVSCIPCFHLTKKNCQIEIVKIQIAKLLSFRRILPFSFLREKSVKVCLHSSEPAQNFLHFGDFFFFFWQKIQN